MYPIKIGAEKHGTLKSGGSSLGALQKFTPMCTPSISVPIGLLQAVLQVYCVCYYSNPDVQVS